MPFQRGFRTESNDSMPYGVAASAKAAMAKALIVRTFCCSSTKPAKQIHKFVLYFRLIIVKGKFVTKLPFLKTHKASAAGLSIPKFIRPK